MVEVVVTFDYAAVEEDELSIKVGDIISDVVKHEGGWWEGSLNGKKGMFPDNFVKETAAKKERKEPVKKQGSTGGGGGGGGHVAQLTAKLGSIKLGPPAVSKKNDTNKKKGVKAKVTYSYTPENEDEIEINVGDVIEVTKQEEEGWWEGRTEAGKEGMFPSNFVQIITGEEEEKPAEEETQEFQEIKGKKMKGVGFGNIFGEGPIKLRKTADPPENNKVDPPMLKTKKVSMQTPAEDAPALPPKKEPREANPVDSSFSNPAGTGNYGNPFPSPSCTPSKPQCFFVMHGDSMMTYDEQPSFEFAGRPSIDSQMYLSFDENSENGSMAVRSSAEFSVATSSEFYTPVGAGGSGDDSIRTLSGEQTPTPGRGDTPGEGYTPGGGDTPGRESTPGEVVTPGEGVTPSGGEEDQEEVPLNLSALSQTRETPPLRRNFVRRKKKGRRECVISPELFTPSPDPRDPGSPALSPVYTITEEPEEEYTTQDMMDDQEMLASMDTNQLQFILTKSPSDPCLYLEKPKKRVSFSQRQEGLDKVASEGPVCPHSILKNTPPKDARLSRLLSYNTPVYNTPGTGTFQADVTDSVKLLKQRRSAPTSPNLSMVTNLSMDKGTQCCLEELLSDDDDAGVKYRDDADFHHREKKPLSRHSSLRQSFHRLRSVFSRGEKTRSLPRNLPGTYQEQEVPDYPAWRSTLPKDAKLLYTEEEAGDCDRRSSVAGDCDRRSSVVGDVVRELAEVRENSLLQQGDGNHGNAGNHGKEGEGRKKRRSWFLFRRHPRRVTPEPEEAEPPQPAEDEQLQQLCFEDTPKTISYLEHMIQTGKVAPAIQRLAMKYELFNNAGDNSNNNALGDMADPLGDMGKENTGREDLRKTMQEFLQHDSLAEGDRYDKVYIAGDKAEYVSQEATAEPTYIQAIHSMLETPDTPARDLSDYEQRMQAIKVRYMAEISNGGLMPTIELPTPQATPQLTPNVSPLKGYSAGYSGDVSPRKQPGYSGDGSPRKQPGYSAGYSGDVWRDLNESLEQHQEMVDTEMSFLSEHEHEMNLAEARFEQVSDGLASAYPDIQAQLNIHTERVNSSIYDEIAPLDSDVNTAEQGIEGSDVYENREGYSPDKLADLCRQLHLNNQQKFDEIFPPEEQQPEPVAPNAGVISPEQPEPVAPNAGVISPELTAALDNFCKTLDDESREADVQLPIVGEAEEEFFEVGDGRDNDAVPTDVKDEYHVLKMAECERQWQELARKSTPSKLRQLTERMLTVLATPFKRIHPFGVRRSEDPSLSVIEEAQEEESLACPLAAPPPKPARSPAPAPGQRPPSQHSLPSPRESPGELDVVIPPAEEGELQRRAVVIVEDVMARVSMETSFRNLSGRVTLLNDVPSSTDIPPIGAESQEYFDASDVLPDTSLHESMRRDCIEDWREITSSPVLPVYTRDKAATSSPVLPVYTRDKAATSSPVLPVYTRDKAATSSPVLPVYTRDKAATFPRKKKFMDRLRRKSYPYPPKSEWQGEEGAGEEEILAGPPQKKQPGILKRLSLRRQPPMSSTPTRADEKEKKPGLLKRLSMRRSTKPPMFEAAGVGDDTKRPKKKPFSGLFRRISMRMRRISGPVPEEITTAISESVVDRSLGSSQASQTPGNQASTASSTGGLRSEGTTTSVTALQGSCSSASTEQPAEECYPLDTSITFSASSLPLPDNTKSPMTRQIYQAVRYQEAPSPAPALSPAQAQSPSPSLSPAQAMYSREAPSPAQAMYSFTYGDSTGSPSHMESTAQEFQQYFSYSPTAQPEIPPEVPLTLPETLPEIPSPQEQEEDRNRLSLHAEMEAELEHHITDSFDYEDMSADIRDIISSLLNPEKPEPYQPQYQPGTEQYQSVPGTETVEGTVEAMEAFDELDAIADTISLEDIDLDLSLPPPRLPIPGGSGDESSSVSSITTEELKELMQNTSDNAGRYYSLTSGSLTPSQSDPGSRAGSHAGSTPCTPASLSGLANLTKNM